MLPDIDNNDDLNIEMAWDPNIIINIGIVVAITNGADKIMLPPDHH